jgi:hypothetical protein
VAEVIASLRGEDLGDEPASLELMGIGGGELRVPDAHQSHACKNKKIRGRSTSVHWGECHFFRSAQA